MYNSKILIIDDDEDDFFITSEYIKEISDSNFTIDWCYNYKKALELIIGGTYDIYFVDYRLGAKTGVDLLKEAIEHNTEEPIILLTGKGNKAIDIEAMRLGATDYLVKSELNSEKMERCIRYALERTGHLKALRTNEQKFRNIFERSKDAIFVADKQLYFRDFNEMSYVLLGYERAELEKMCLYDMVPEEIDSRYIRNLLAGNGDIIDFEMELSTKSGERKNCILSLASYKDSEQVEYVQGIIHDITNMKKAEKANLQVEKLAVAGRLVRTLAHEVRNPLNNINMSIEHLLEQASGEDESRLYLDIIHRNGGRIGDLITELLDSSRPTELQFAEHSLQAVMDESVNAAIDRISLRKISLELKYPDQPLQVLVDKEKLKIAFLNIIINAVEAMEEQTGKLSIVLDSYDHVHQIVIRDNGCGIPAENITRLFEPYFTSKRNGVGLGLASTLNILQSHKAKVDVSSVINEGTVFTIIFPQHSVE
ncbi:MAG: hybrid sensor histidine kinase/response regulator [Chitinophagaceae bacterium]|nr:MAG: hybrid sensor histidine kinase/response regulator [Chitinophagaceae bacterium]